jgi:hypothetical protein
VGKAALLGIGWVLVVLATASPVQASPCTHLRLIPVAPRFSQATPEPCPVTNDKQACQLHDSFQKLARAPMPRGDQPVYLFDESPISEKNYPFYFNLIRSESVRAVNRLRIEAREIAYSSDVCEPNYIYLEDGKIFGAGPAFVSSSHFEIGGKPTSNLTVVEDGKVSYLPFKALSKESLLRNHYLDLAVTHEIAHGIMQDLYGVDEFSRLEKSVVSRNGHFASSVTDPALAWIEGFAEGFEAFYGEKSLGPAPLQTPYLDRMFEQARDNLDSGFFKRFWFGISNTVENVRNLDDLVSEFLKSERQIPIRENHYVTQGTFSNLSHHYNMLLATDDLDQEALAAWNVESSDAIWSKEGAVAHLIYAILREGLERPMFEAIHEARPAHFQGFLTAFLTKVSIEKAPLLKAALVGTLSENGRILTRDMISHPYGNALAKKQLMSDLASTELPRLIPPADLWIEFSNRSLGHSALFGKMDRINLNTTTPSRFRDFVKSLSWRWLSAEKDPTSLRTRNELFDHCESRFLQLRAKMSKMSKMSNGPSVGKLAALFSLEGQADLAKGDQIRAAAFDEIAENLLQARQCFQTRCLSTAEPSP